MKWLKDEHCPNCESNDGRTYSYGKSNCYTDYVKCNKCGWKGNLEDLIRTKKEEDKKEK